MSDIWTSAWPFRKTPDSGKFPSFKKNRGARENVEITHGWRVVMTPGLFDGLQGSFGLNRMLALWRKSVPLTRNFLVNTEKG